MNLPKAFLSEALFLGKFVWRLCFYPKIRHKAYNWILFIFCVLMSKLEKFENEDLGGFNSLEIMMEKMK